MKIVQVQFSLWDKVYSFSLPDEVKAGVGDFVIVETELGRELGKLVGFSTSSPEEHELKPVIRLATVEDASSVFNEERRERAMAICQELIERHGRQMKLIDARFSYAGNRLTFAFVAEGRVDFRDLVKDLNAAFNLNIRLLQIGSRDEARCTGDCGPCGLHLCCRSFVHDFSSITSEMAEAQQVVHRGSDRISGMCGRLMCCLSFEYEGYKHLATELPPLGTRIKVEGRTGVVVGHHLLKQTLDVRFSSENEGERDFTIQVDPKKQLDNNKSPRPERPRRPGRRR
ncbi:stage 0 sporulation protein [Candidatus Falkowbacteria bacterium HGW-Falkowbacteria-2]|uniref:Stage 0 sporulation protein n=1 Tax=Candidatus Falkowbacteria bacterium HGW-Falkowbacteria-2 TaxID=2013769 RepID=A0A2N2E1B6_9BACT|nr:MAG: stage 0 sporulation protein [Candidatus Falkowbacteria bacterium HGW-Falkowbacteria-2]